MDLIRNKQSIVWFILAVLVGLGLITYFPVGQFNFIDVYDDWAYVTGNPVIKAGLTLRGITWAFTGFHAANWHPVTWLSHMLDVSLFGLEPGNHHYVNLFFHITNTIILFLVIYRMTGALWRCSIVAILFMVHPLHVESVAWVAERKDVLSTLFGFLALYCYVLYVERPRIIRYVPVFIFTALGLMSKPMLVTFPIILVLLDYWPLKRFNDMVGRKYLICHPSAKMGLVNVCIEKLPLVLLAIGSCWITYIAQETSDAMKCLGGLPVGTRIANAGVAYVRYIIHMFVPISLSVAYPHPINSLPAWKMIGSFLVLSSFSVFAIIQRNRRPYIFVGWAWYLVMLIPVIGLVQVGYQAMADRYTYLPLVGLFVIVAWSMPDITYKSKIINGLLLGVSAVVVVLMIILTRSQLSYWSNSTTLFLHAVKVDSGNWLAHNNLGAAFEKIGKEEDAKMQYMEAIRLKPDYLEPYNNLGVVLAREGRYAEASTNYIAALSLEPGSVAVHNNYGSLLVRLGDIYGAINQFQEVIKINPDFAEAYYNLGYTMEKIGMTRDAIQSYRKALSVDPELFVAHTNLGILLAKYGNTEEAVYHFRESIRIYRHSVSAHYHLAIALQNQGKMVDAIAHYREALRIAPGDKDIALKLANALESRRP